MDSMIRPIVNHEPRVRLYLSLEKLVCTSEVDLRRIDLSTCSSPCMKCNFGSSDSNVSVLGAQASY